MKVPLVSAHVCFSVPPYVNSFLAACKDKSHACQRPTPPLLAPPSSLSLINFPSQVACMWGKTISSLVWSLLLAIIGWWWKIYIEGMWARLHTVDWTFFVQGMRVHDLPVRGAEHKCQSLGGSCRGKHRTSCEEDGGRQHTYKLCSIRYIKSTIKGSVERSYSYEAMPNSFTSKIK